LLIMKMRMSTLALALLCAVAVLAQPIPSGPGISTTVQSSLPENVVDKIVVQLQQKLQGAPIPDISHTISIPVLGKFTYKITNIKIKKINFIDTKLVTSPTAGFNLLISNADGDLTSDWSYEFKSIIIGDFGDNGTAKIKASDVSGNFGVLLGDLNGRMTATAPVNSFDFGHFRIHLTANNIATWILDILTLIFDSTVKHHVERRVEGIVSKDVKNFNVKLQSKDPVTPIGTKLLIDNSLTGNPVFTSAIVSFPFAGQFLDSNSPDTPPPYAPIAMPTNVTTDPINLMINQYFFQSFGWVLWQTQLLSAKLNSTTTEWKEAIPGLYNTYPNQPLLLEVDLYQAVDVNVSSGGIYGDAAFLLDYIVFNGTQQQSVLQLQMEAFINISLLITYNESTPLLIGSCQAIGVGFKVLDSSVGKVNVAPMNIALKTLFNTVIRPRINSALSAGIPLTLPPFAQTLRPTLVYGNGYLAFTLASA